MDDPIPFNRPSLVDREIDFLREAVGRGQLSGDGHFTRLCAVTSVSRVTR